MFKHLFTSFIIFLIFVSSVQAYEFREPQEYDVTDVQMWYGKSDGSSRLATGICYGPFMEFVNSKNVRLIELIRPCTMVNYNGKSDSSNTSGGIGLNLFSIMGFTGSVFQDVINGDFKFGVGFSVSQIFGSVTQTKPLEHSPSSTITPLPASFGEPIKINKSEFHNLVSGLNPDMVYFRD